MVCNFNRQVLQINGQLGRWVHHLQPAASVGENAQAGSMARNQ